MHPVTRDPASHKGDNGRILIIGGSADYVGAVALAGIACLRSGADWVTIAAPEKVAWAINKLSPDLITKKLKGDYISTSHYPELKKLIKTHDVTLIGNGAGVKPATKKLIKKAVAYSVQNKKYLVIDADALKIINIRTVENAVLTPHKKEFEILLKNSSIEKSVLTKIFNKKASLKKKLSIVRKILNNNILLLKGPVDAIISKTRITFNRTGNAGMTKAGTGDVLAGLTAGFLAQTHDLYRSACLAAYYNGRAGDALKKKKGYTYLASELAEEITKFSKKI
ncbi:MAG TPA: NAD(P)H-hydrate dehydratase [Candidatus Nanoarchaeia archaeon]|nr:NAD(P)H-hydrate dehydratase [Candidatus Nanoarchaeia archaeon]